MKRLVTGVFCALLVQSALTVTVEARPYHRARHYHAHHHHHHHYRHHKHHRRYRITPSRYGAVRTEVPSFGAPSFPSLLGHTDSIVQKARSYLGAGAVFGRRNLWCARFMNVVLRQTGHHGTGSDAARSFAKFPATTMRPGAIAVMRRKGGGHVGVVSGIGPKGNPIIISGNHNGRVAETIYPRSRVYKFVQPL